VPLHLTSTRSPRVQALRALHERAERRAEGRFIVEGPHSVQQAIIRGLAQEVWVRDDVDAPADWPVDVLGNAAVMKAVSQTVEPQGVLAVCAIPRMDLQAILAKPGQIMILDRLADPGNVGTLIRTAAAVGAAGVALTAGSVDPCNDKVVRSSAGTWFDVAIAEGLTPDAINRAVKTHGRIVVALDGQSDVDMYEAIHAGRIPLDAAWIVGSEAHGVDPAFNPDIRVRIPMAASVESLNASVAGALCLYANRHAPRDQQSASHI
jgi:RNA methyltransferase, TrmH family